MNITAAQLAGKPKKIGKKGDKDIMHVATKGGLHMVVAQKGAGFETLGTGPHPGVAKFIANRRYGSEISWSDLNKADYVDPIHFADCLPKYEALTDAMRKLQGL
jgi:hypothetical protein